MNTVIKNLNKFKKDGKIKPPEWLIQNIQYLCQMGSVAYGVSNNNSDIDVYGFCIPKIEYIFPHVKGLIHGFDEIRGFDQWQKHHLKDESNNKEYDFSIYNIIKYFRLVMDNNPNMIDSLFVPRRCVLYTTQIGEYIRENRKLFLHKGSWFKFKGYSFSQLHKMQIKNPEPGTKRFEMVQKYGYDLKFAYHVVRLLNEIEQILVEGDLDLERNREQLKSIRRGKWTLQDVLDYFAMKEKSLEKIYTESKLRNRPDKKRIKQILINCLEMHYGNIEKFLRYEMTDCEEKIKKIKKILEG